MRSTVLCVGLICAAYGVTFAQQKQNNVPLAGAPVRLSRSEAALLASVEIVKGPAGQWKCTSERGRVCTAEEGAAYSSVNQRRNAKENLPIALDGTFKCVGADGKPCTEAAIQKAVTQMRAITKGGQQGF